MDNRTIEEVRKNETKLINEIKSLEEQLKYLRSGEYYNQLRFENEMLQQVVDTNGVPSEVYDYIDCTHRNTELLKENQELKLELSGYRQAILEDKDMLGLKEENTELKKQLEEYKLITIDYQELEARNQELKKKYENAVADYENTMAEKEQLNSLVNSCQEEIRQLKKQLEISKMANSTNVDLSLKLLTEKENQQKEFIKYLEDEIKRLKENDIYQSLQKMALATHEHILQKYRSITGVSDEKK